MVRTDGRSQIAKWCRVDRDSAMPLRGKGDRIGIVLTFRYQNTGVGLDISGNHIDERRGRMTNAHPRGLDANQQRKFAANRVSLVEPFLPVQLTATPHIDRT